ncbi:MAG TPA: AAA family ATPase [bacterium]|nr:AAA family ATPase [bacterium]
MRNRLEKITLKGFKTIRELVDFKLEPLTVQIGPNGAGKSNFLSFFHMLALTVPLPHEFELYVGQQGGASVLLLDGPDKTREIEAEITIATEDGEVQYHFQLAFAAGDTLIYADESFRHSSPGFILESPWHELGAGHRESRLTIEAGRGDMTADLIINLFREVRRYQFNNTSWTAGMRLKCDLDDTSCLIQNAANIAPFLWKLKENDRKYYLRIVDTIRLILPFFADFELEPQYGKLLLRWRERDSDRLFSASQAADGMLRVIALVTLLLQPEETLPDVLILDEPELGLHPYAINVIAGLIRAASINTQVIVATQSTAFVDCFEPEDIVVVDRENRESTFRRLNSADLKEWLEDYSLSELWEKNVIGGSPL